METRNRLTRARGERGEDEAGKEGEGPSQGTDMNDPWTWTTGWGLTVGGGSAGQGKQGGKIGTTVIEQQ